ncbi:MAG: rRNA maturation RNase YbeY [Anaerolineae bacterium]|nr:rRNA maturation RNase YbeY [Anaerolineae bacterium]
MSQDYTIYVTMDEPYPVDEAAVQMAAWYALSVSQAEAPLALTVTLATTERVYELNRDYAGVDEPTDVLAFAAEEEAYAVEPGEPPYIGDVIIAYPVAEEQAAKANTPIIKELQLLTIHGTLHLLGYDHDTPDRQAEMWAFQSAAMDAVRSDAG